MKDMTTNLNVASGGFIGSSSSHMIGDNTWLYNPYGGGVGGTMPPQPPLGQISLHSTLTQPSLDAIRQIVREEVRPVVSPANNPVDVDGASALVRKILDRIGTVRGEMEYQLIIQQCEQRALDMQSDLIDEIEEMCRQIVTKG